MSLTLFCYPLFAEDTLAEDTLYVATNNIEKNSILAVTYQGNGEFKLLGEFITGGKGSGDLEVPGLVPRNDQHPLLDGQNPLMSTFGIQITDDRRFLLVINPGDGTLSSMKIFADGSLTHINTVASGGSFPVSLGTHGNQLVVASIGKGNFKGRIASFKIGENGFVSPVPGSIRVLDHFGGRPSSIRFTPNGKHVVVSMLLSGSIMSYELIDGVLSEKPAGHYQDNKQISNRSLANPIGIEFIDQGDNGAIAVVGESRFFSEGFALPSQHNELIFQSSSMASYFINTDGEITNLSRDVISGLSKLSGQRHLSGITLTHTNKVALGTNALDSSISSYHIADDGQLNLWQEKAYVAPEYSYLTEIRPSRDGKTIYQLHGFGGAVSALQLEENGLLKPLGTWEGIIPKVGAFGLAIN